MSDFVLTLKIDKIGDREALNALNDLDKKGRQIIEGVSGATGRAMGDIAVAYERGSKTIRNQLQGIAEGHESNIRVMQAEQNATEKALASVSAATDRAASRASTATVAISRGLETMARTGKEGGRSLDTVISSIASGFGLGGPIVGAIGIATVAIIEMFARASRESAKAARDISDDFSKIAHMDVKGQGEAASLLYSGDPNEYGLDENGKPKLARFSVPSLRTQQADLTKQSDAGTRLNREGLLTMSADAKDAADALKRVNAELERRNALLPGITGPGGSMMAAGKQEAADNLPGFITDQLAAQAAATKAATTAARKAHDAAIKAFARGVEERQKERDAAVATEVAKITDANDPNVSLNENLARALNRKIGTASGSVQGGILAGMVPTKEQEKAFANAIKLSITNSLKDLANDPLVEAATASAKLGKHLTEILKTGLGDGLVSSIDAGMKAAFAGSGAGGFLKAFGQSMLSALGGIMEQMGAALIQYGIAMEMISVALTNPFTAGPAAIAAGALLVALGAALSGAASGRGGASASMGGASSAAGLSQIIDRGIIDPRAYSQTQASSISARPSVTNHITLIGANDPRVQSDLAEIIRKSTMRGLL
jgi:hypothetical protein